MSDFKKARDEFLEERHCSGSPTSLAYRGGALDGIKWAREYFEPLLNAEIEIAKSMADINKRQRHDSRGLKSQLAMAREALEAVADRHIRYGDIPKFGVAHGLATVCKNALARIDVKPMAIHHGEEIVMGAYIGCIGTRIVWPKDMK